MTKAAHLPPPREPRPVTIENLRVGREFLDVTWRMAVPVVLFAGAGLLADRHWGSKPWLTLLGTLVGFLFAALLVKRQIGSLPDDPPATAARPKPDSKPDNLYDDEDED